MNEIITDIHNLSAANNLAFVDSGESVACLALVSTMSATHLNLPASRVIIALKAEDVGRDLIMQEVEPYMINIIMHS
jgi:hypothetical protein